MRNLLMTGMVSAMLAACSGASSTDLGEVHRSIESRFDQISHLDADTFSALSGDDLVVFDVREKREYEVSHIEGAVWIDPNISAADFIKRYGVQAAGKDVVFYCSVGERSSRLAQRVSEMESASFKVHNLEKGIFGWHNEGRALARGEKTTDQIHPFDEKWGQLITRQDKVSYEAK